MRFAEMTWPDLRAVSRETVVLAPFGACEQHGPFLPFFTDAILVGEAASRAESQLGSEVLLLPTQWMGASQHHLPFGAITADVDTHVRIVAETCDSVLQAGFHRILVLNGHGGNIDTMHLALRQLDMRYPEATLASTSYWVAAANEVAAILEGSHKSAGHACEMETSLMLTLRPDLVRTDLIRDDGNWTSEVLRGISITRNSAEWGEVGALGYATLASAQKGERLMQAIVARVVEAVRALAHTGPGGMAED